MNVQQFAELAAGHAVNALSPDDEREFGAALSQHPEWSSIAEEDAATATYLSYGVVEVTPPAFVRAVLLARIDALSAAAPADREGDHASPPADEMETLTPATGPTTTDAVQTVQRRSWIRGMFGLAAALVLLIGLGFGAALVNQQLNRSVDVLALEQIEAAADAQEASGQLADGGEVTAHWSESVGKVVIVSDGLPRLASDQAFEMWFVRGGEAIPAGTFTADGGDTTSLLDGELRAGDTLAITVEAAGGSVTGEPTSDPIVSISTDA